MTTEKSAIELEAVVPPLPAYPFLYNGLLLTDGNKAVISNDFGHLCGYVALRPHQVPEEWHGSYTADGLVFLAVHGGITFCSVGGGDEEERERRIEAVKSDASFEDASFEEIELLRNSAARSVPYDWVVFGFDCGHHGDDLNANLSDPNYVLGLAGDMEKIILALCAENRRMASCRPMEKGSNSR